MAFNTNNPIGSTDPRDLSDNSQNFDSALNSNNASWSDRLGVSRPTIPYALDNLNATSYRTFGSVSFMVAQADLAIGHVVSTTGYYTPGDGGGTDYEIVAGATGTADGGSFINLDNGLQAKGLFGSTMSAEQFGAVGDGGVNDTAALQALAGNCIGKVVWFDGEKNYLIDTVSFPGNCTLVTNGALFTYSGVSAGSNTAVLGFSGLGRLIADTVRLSVPTGIIHQRFVDISASDVEIGRIEVNSVDQQGYGNELLDGAVRITANSVRISSYEISNSDRAFIINNADNVDLGPGTISSYRLGLWIDKCNRVRVSRPIITVGSPNATADPGNNGILMGGVTDIYIDEPIIEDSGEHGIRIGSSTDSDNVTINRPRVLRPGRNGIKIRPDAANKAHNLWINYPQVTDAGFGGAASGDNKNGILIQRCIRATVTEPRILKDSRAVCAVRGIECFNVDVLRIQGGFIDDPAENGLFVTSVGVDDAGTTIFKDNNIIYAHDLFITSPGQSAILIDYQNAILRDLDVDFVSKAAGAYALEMKDDSGVGIILQRGSARIRSEDAASGVYGGSGFRPAQMLVNVVASVLEGFIGSDGVTGNNLPAGVSVTKVSTGVYDISHSLGLADKGLIPYFVAYDSNVWPVVIANADTNVMRVKFQTASGTVFDSDFFFQIRSNGRQY